jgi:hypothetical protein
LGHINLWFNIYLKKEKKMADTLFEIVKNGKPQVAIIAFSLGPVSYAAKVIQKYIERMTNVQLPIISDEKKIKGNKIIIRVREKVAKFDGFFLKIGRNVITIEASIPRGCVYGAYALLEEVGCRFYGPEPLGVIIPKKKNVSLPVGLKILKEPAFENRLPSFGTPELHICWGFNFTWYPKEQKDKELIREIGLKTFQWGHLWRTLIENQFFPDGRSSIKMDYSDKEDWLPVDEKGIRKPTSLRNEPGPHGRVLCFSNTDALKWFVENATNWVLSNCPDSDYISIWPADTPDLWICQCERCKKTGWKQTDWYIYVHNKIWSLLKTCGFKGIFGWIAYYGTEEPPSKVKLVEDGKDMDFLYAPRPRGASMHGPITNNHSVNLSYRENIQRWQKYLGKFKGNRTVFEYYFDLALLGHLPSGRTFLIPKLKDMKEEMLFYLNQNFNGFFDCSPPSSVLFPDPLSKWIYRKLLWDINLNIEEAKLDFYRNYYGDFANIIQKIREEVEQLMFEDMKLPMGFPAHHADRPIKRLKELETQLDEMIKKIRKDEILKQRIEVMKLWVRYCTFVKESEYHAKITRDKEKGKKVEENIRKLFEENKDFLVKTGLMKEEDVEYLAQQVTKSNLSFYFNQ